MTRGKKIEKVNPIAESDKIDSKNIDQFDLEETSVHEAGHFVVGEHFGMTINAQITDSGQSTIADKRFTGKCFYKPSISHFQNAMFSWAGILAEHMFSLNRNQQKELDSREPNDLASEIQEHLELEVIGASPTDLTGIRAHPHEWKTCRRTAELLRRKKDRVLEVAKLLVDTKYAHWSKLSPLN